jgi:hypothetical protein
LKVTLTGRVSTGASLVRMNFSSPKVCTSNRSPGLVGNVTRLLLSAITVMVGLSYQHGKLSNRFERRSGLQVCAICTFLRQIQFVYLVYFVVKKSVFIRVHPWLKMPKLIFAFFAYWRENRFVQFVSQLLFSLRSLGLLLFKIRFVCSAYFVVENPRSSVVKKS